MIIFFRGSGEREVILIMKTSKCNIILNKVPGKINVLDIKGLIVCLDMCWCCVVKKGIVGGRVVHNRLTPLIAVLDVP